MSREILKLLLGENFTVDEENEKNHIKVIDRMLLNKEIKILFKVREIELNCKARDELELLCGFSRGGLASMNVAFDLKLIAGKCRPLALFPPFSLFASFDSFASLASLASFSSFAPLVLFMSFASTRKIAWSIWLF